MIYFSLPMYNYVLKANKPPSYSKMFNYHLLSVHFIHISTYLLYKMNIHSFFIHPKSHKKGRLPHYMKQPALHYPVTKLIIRTYKLLYAILSLNRMVYWASGNAP